MVSIIVPIRYRADLTRVCLDSIMQYTTVDFELIIVQEGEDKEITELLRKYNGKFVQNKEPKGFAGAMNSGLKLAKGDYYCFLNNDTVVTPGWLEEMLKIFDDKEIGLVAPTFTEAETRQSVDLNNENEVEYVDDPLSLKGVCFLIKKSVIDKIGEWDERFGLGGGDDNDMCYRVKQAGYKMAIARKSYIYHYGSASFRELRNNNVEEAHKYAVEQFNKFKKKHGIKEPPKIMIAIPTFSGNVNNELVSRLIQWSHDREFAVNIYMPKGMVPLDNARNHCVKIFLQNYLDYLCFINDDIVPPPNALRELILADKDVIAPLCFNMREDMNGVKYPCPVAYKRQKNGEYQIHYGKGIEETDNVMGGMFLIKRKVLVNMERPFAFTYKKDGTLDFSEDIYFSQKAKERGYKLYTNYDLLCKHYKVVDVKDVNDLMLNYGRKSSN